MKRGVLIGFLVSSGLFATMAIVFVTTPWRGAEAGSPPPTITFTAVDLDVTGNAATALGPVNSTLSNQPLNTPFVVDFVVSGVPPGRCSFPEPDGQDPCPGDNGGIFGVGFELLYNPAVISVQALSTGHPTPGVLHEADGGVSVDAFDPLPDADGDFRVDTVSNLTHSEESGSGRVVQLSLRCEATGGSGLRITDRDRGGGEVMGVFGNNFSIVYNVAHEFEAAVGCGQPAPNLPATLTVNKDFSDNNPDDVTIEVNCTGSGAPVAVDTLATEPDPARFTLHNPGPGVSCTATEGQAPPGYTANQAGCANISATSVSHFVCTIVNTVSTLNPATLLVHKDFSDDNPADVTIAVSCTGGASVVVVDDTASEADPAGFAIVNPGPGVTCTATESMAPVGYTANQTDCAAVPIASTAAFDCVMVNSGTATFVVRKVFVGNAPTSVEIDLTCDSGMVVDVDTSASEADPANFTVNGFGPGATCDATELPGLIGYTVDDVGCQGVALTAGAESDCTITNRAHAEVIIRKDFTDDNPAEVTVNLTCDTGVPFDNNDNSASESEPSVWSVDGFDPLTQCHVTETTPSGYVEQANNCSTFTMPLPGTPVTCTITNTPTTATLTVSKDYQGGGPEDQVTVTVTCSNPSAQVTGPQPADEGLDAVFTLTHFTDEDTCTASEGAPPAGYTADESGCLNVSITNGGTPSCTITNAFTGPSASPSPSPSPTPTPSPSPTPTRSPTPTPSPTPSPTETPVPTPTPTLTPSPSPTPSPTPTPTATATPTPANQVVWGDHNCSEDADVADSLITLLYDAGLGLSTGDCPEMGEMVTVDGVLREWGDVDCSGETNVIDALKILRYDAGMEVNQTSGCPEIGELVTLS